MHLPYADGLTQQGTKIFRFAQTSALRFSFDRRVNDMQKGTVDYVMSVLFFRTSAWNYSAPIRRIFMKFENDGWGGGDFSEICLEKLNFH
jgi:hypothetical protein